MSTAEYGRCHWCNVAEIPVIRVEIGLICRECTEDFGYGEGEWS